VHEDERVSVAAGLTVCPPRQARAGDLGKAALAHAA